MNPMAQNPWLIPVMGVFWFFIYFGVFYFFIKRFNLKTPGREDDDILGEGTEYDTHAADDKYLITGSRFIDALGGKENITRTRELRHTIADGDRRPEQGRRDALKRAGAAGTMKPGGKSVQVDLRNERPVREGRDGAGSSRERSPCRQARRQSRHRSRRGRTAVLTDDPGHHDRDAAPAARGHGACRCPRSPIRPSRRASWGRASRSSRPATRCRSRRRHHRGDVRQQPRRRARTGRRHGAADPRRHRHRADEG